MYKVLASSVCAVCSIAATTAFAQSANMKLSQAECQAVWQKADPNSAGSLTQTQAQAYVSDFKSVDADNNGSLSSAEFMKGCESGLIKGGSASTGAASGSSGADAPKAPAASK